MGLLADLDKIAEIFLNLGRIPKGRTGRSKVVYETDDYETGSCRLCGERLLQEYLDSFED